MLRGSCGHGGGAARSRASLCKGIQDRQELGRLRHSLTRLKMTGLSRSWHFQAFCFGLGLFTSVTVVSFDEYAINLTRR